MKETTLNTLVIAVLATALVNLSSCEKDEGKLPNIAFKTTNGYTHSDASVSSGATVLVGITASKSEEEDVLKTFNVSKSVDGAAATTISNTTLTGSQGDSYDTDYTITAGAAGHTEKWLFTVTNRDGLTNTVSFTLTVN
ncbi:MAG TPA: hypothetical protein VK174_17505 [Chitinophagales bacterium]|nr:hypothetical protein [Chitinophagales bacterium]